MYFENEIGWICINNQTVTAATFEEVIYFKSAHTIDINKYFYDFVSQLEAKEKFRQSRLNKFLEDENI